MDVDIEELFRAGRERWEKMTTLEIATELGTTVQALYRWARLGKIPGLTEKFLDSRRRMDPLREVDRGDFEPGSFTIEYEYTWNRGALKKLKRYKSLEDLIELGFTGGNQGRFDRYVSIRVFDRLTFFAGTTPIALLDCQGTWFVADIEEVAGTALAEDIDLVADFIENIHEEPYRIRPSLYFLEVEAAQEGLLERVEAPRPRATPGQPEPGRR